MEIIMFKKRMLVLFVLFACNFLAMNAQPFTITTRGPNIQVALRYRDGRMQGLPNGILLSIASKKTSFSAQQVPEAVWIRRASQFRGAGAKYPEAPWHEYRTSTIP